MATAGAIPAAIHQAIIDWVASFHGYFQSAATVTNITQTANSSAIVPFQTLTAEAFNATVNQTIKEALNQTQTLNSTVTSTFTDKASAFGWNILEWGYHTVGYAGSAVKNLFFATSEGSEAIGKASQLGTSFISAGQSVFAITDGFGLYLYQLYIDHGPATMAAILQAAQLRMQQEEKDKKSPPEGWGIATLMITFASAALLVHGLQMLHRSQTQKEIASINEWIADLKYQLHHEQTSLLSYIGKGVKYGAMGFVGFSLAATFTLPLVACSTVALASPIVFTVAERVWSKLTGKKEITAPSDILEMIAAAERIQDMLNKMSQDHERQKVVQALALKAVSGDPKAVAAFLKIIDPSMQGDPIANQYDEEMLPEVTVIRTRSASTISPAFAMSSGKAATAVKAQTSTPKSLSQSSDEFVQEEPSSANVAKLSKRAQKKLKKLGTGPQGSNR